MVRSKVAGRQSTDLSIDSVQIEEGAIRIGKSSSEGEPVHDSGGRLLRFYPVFFLPKISSSAAEASLSVMVRACSGSIPLAIR